MEITFHFYTIFLFANFPLSIGAIASVLLVIFGIVLYRKQKAGKKTSSETEETVCPPLSTETEDAIESKTATPPPPAKQPVITKQTFNDSHGQCLFEDFISARMEAADFYRGNDDIPALYVSGGGENKIQLAIVCRWKEAFIMERVEWARSFEMVKYRSYESENSVRLFIVIGVGGDPQSPGLISFIPLQALRSNVLTKAQLENYSGREMIGASLAGQDKSSTNVETR